MGFGGDSSPPTAPSYPPLPPKAEWMDFISQRTGVEAVKVTGPDGKDRIIDRRLPRSAEDQKFFDFGGDLMDKAMIEVKKLATYDPTAVVDFAPFINIMNDLNTERKADMAELSKLPDFNQYVEDYKKMGNQVLQDEFKKQENENEAYLADMGYSKSTAALGMKLAFDAQKSKILKEFDTEANFRGQQAKAADQALRQNEFGFRDQGRAGQLQKAQAEHQLKLNQADQIASQRQQALQNQYGLFKLGADIRGEDHARAAMGRAPELANQIFQQNSMDSLNRYNSQVNATNAQYQNQMASYQNQRPSFGETALQLGGMGVGAYFGGPWGAFVGGQAGKIGGQGFRR